MNKDKGSRKRLWDAPDATRSPRNDIGMLATSGCKNTRNTGIIASVRKKFQCMPYSVTCSFIHCKQCVPFETNLTRKTHWVLSTLHQHDAD